MFWNDAEDGNIEVLKLLFNFFKIAQGEVLQLQHRGTDMLEETYLKIIFANAELFSSNKVGQYYQG